MRQSDAAISFKSAQVSRRNMELVRAVVIIRKNNFFASICDRLGVACSKLRKPICLKLRESLQVRKVGRKLFGLNELVIDG